MTKPPRLLFASYHAYLDPSSGAALSTRDLFEDLTTRGWDCRVVCGPKLDYEDRRGPADILHHHQIPYRLQRFTPPRWRPYELFQFSLNGVPVVQYRPEGFTPATPPTREEGIPFLDVLSNACKQFRPDVVLTYGGSSITLHLISRVRQAGVKVVFALHNFAYTNSPLFREVNAIRVPSQYAQRWYRERVGLETEVVEYPRDLARARADRVDGRFVTFINPVPVKGVAWFARIALEVRARRKDIPFLVVEGRGGIDRLGQLPLDLSKLTNLHMMRSTPRPKEFYAISRIVLMPSLWEETFGRVAAETLANGIPLLASRRGALPETLGGAGFLFDIPERYTTPERMMDVPTSAEVAEWVNVIERLWDDPEFYAQEQAKARARAVAWEPDRLRSGVEAFFRRVAGSQ